MKNKVLILLVALIIVTASFGSVAIAAPATEGGVDEEQTETILIELAELDTTLSESELRRQAYEDQQPVIDYLNSLDGAVVVDQFWITNAIVAEVDTDQVPLDTIESHSEVVKVEYDQSVSGPSTETPFTSMSTPDDPATYGLELINAPKAWETFGTQGENVTVGVIDSGISTSHISISLNNSYSADNYNGSWHTNYYSNGTETPADHREGPSAPTPFDSNGHGTHVSGTIAGGNQTGSAIGVAPDSRLIHSVALYDGVGTGSKITRSLQWMIEQKPDVVTMSLGADTPSSTHIQAIDTLRSHGIIVVAASGNSGNNTIIYPAGYENVTAVGSVDSSRSVVSTSSGAKFDPVSEFGSIAEGWENPQYTPYVAAPGASIYSANYLDDDGLILQSGTSMAAPHASGVIALMLSNNPNLTPDQVDKVLRESATPAAGVLDGRNTRSGYGIVNAYEALTHSDPDGFAAPHILSANNTVITGDNITVVANISNENVLGATADRDVRFYVNGTEVANESFNLASEENSTVKFSYQTSQVDVGTKNLTIATGDENTTATTIVGDEAKFDIALEPANNPEQTIVGQNATLNATVQHLGGVPSSATVDLLVNGTPVVTDKQTSVIESGANGSVEFDYKPTDADVGTIKFGARVGTNVSNLTLDALKPGNLSVSVESPSSFEQGSEVELNWSVTNVGEVAKLADVNMTIEDVEEQSFFYTFNPGDTNNFTTTYSTSASDYPELNATAFTPDANDSVTVTLTPNRIFNVSNLTGPSEVESGSEITFTANVMNIGAADGTQNLTLYIDGQKKGELTNVQLNASESKTVTFESDPVTNTGKLYVFVPSNDVSASTYVNVTEVTTSDSGGDSGGGGGGGSGGAAPAPAPEPEPEPEPTNETETENNETTTEEIESESITTSESVKRGDIISIDVAKELGSGESSEAKTLSGLQKLDIEAAEDSTVDVEIVDKTNSGETPSVVTANQGVLSSVEVNYNDDKGDGSSMGRATLQFTYSDGELEGYNVDSLWVVHEKSDGSSNRIDPTVERTEAGYLLTAETDSFSTFSVVADRTEETDETIYTELDDDNTSSDTSEGSTEDDQESTDEETPGFGFTAALLALTIVLAAGVRARKNQI